MAPSATPLPLPTIAPTLLLSTPAPSNGSSIAPIVFAPNATYQVMTGNIAGGSSQTYSLNAFAGQVMSVSILPEQPELQDTFQLEIRGRDGTVLCPVEDHPCSFWRGALPSAQEYLIRVDTRSGGAINMRVAINPPGTVSQTFGYADPQGRFALSYPDTFAPVHYIGPEITKIPPDLALAVT